VRAFGADAGLSEDDLFGLDVCLTEALTNSIRYGGLNGKSPLTEIACEATARLVRCTVVDAGVAFDPVGATPPPLPPSLAEAGEGGAGIRLIREFSDECTYEWRDGRNVFSFVLQRHGTRAGSPADWIERGADRRVGRNREVFPPLIDAASPVAQDRRSGQDRRANGFISQVRMFRGAPYSAMEPLVADCPRVSIAAGEVWLAPGGRSNDVAIVLRGRLRVHVERPDSRPTFLIDVGHCAGEMQLLDGKPASAFVIADVDSDLLLIPAELLREGMLAIPKVASNLLAILAGRIRRSDRLIAEQVRAALELERLQREIKLAQEIQINMLPVPPLFPGLPQIDCAGFMRAATTVGGDFYDAFGLDAGHVFLTIGDICGKGLPSALFMVRTLTTLWNETSRRRNPQRIVELLNTHLCTNNDSSLFVSLFCGVYDLATHQFTFVNAGHNAPLISIDGEPFRPLQGHASLVAGVSPQAVYRATNVVLKPGSTLVLYTDGVTDAESVNNQWFGEDRLIQTVERARGGSMAELADAVLSAVDVFARGAEQADDVTLLAFRVNT